MSGSSGLADPRSPFALRPGVARGQHRRPPRHRLPPRGREQDPGAGPVG